MRKSSGDFFRSGKRAKKAKSTPLTVINVNKSCLGVSNTQKLIDMLPKDDTPLEIHLSGYRTITIHEIYILTETFKVVSNIKKIILEDGKENLDLYATMALENLSKTLSDRGVEVIANSVNQTGITPKS